jgi:hypothetical protein
MDIPMSTAKPDIDVVFYNTAYKKWRMYWYPLLVLQVGGLFYLFTHMVHDSSFLPMSLFIICVNLYCSMYFYRLYRATRLIISNSGLEYYGLKFQLTTSWDDLGLARNRTILSLFSPVRLTSKKPIIKRNLLFDWDFDTLWGKARYFIPLSSWHWDRYTELVGLIKQHRPDLLLE